MSKDEQEARNRLKALVEKLDTYQVRIIVAFVEELFDLKEVV